MKKRFSKTLFVDIHNQNTSDEFFEVYRKLEDFELDSFPETIAVYRLEKVVKADVEIKVKESRTGGSIRG